MVLERHTTPLSSPHTVSASSLAYTNGGGGVAAGTMQTAVAAGSLTPPRSLTPPLFGWQQPPACAAAVPHQGRPTTPTRGPLSAATTPPRGAGGRVSAATTPPRGGQISASMTPPRGAGFPCSAALWNGAAQQSQYASLQQQVAKCRVDIESAETTAKSALKLARIAERDLDDERLALRAAESREQKVQADLSQLEAQLKVAQMREQKAERELEESEQVSELKLKQALKRVQELEQELAKTSASASAERQEFSASLSKYQTAQRERRSTEDKARRLQRLLDEAQQREARQSEELKQLHVKLEEEQRSRQDSEERERRGSEVVAALETKLVEERDQHQVAQESWVLERERLEKSMSDQDRELSNIRQGDHEEVARLEMDLARITAQRDGLLEELSQLEGEVAKASTISGHWRDSHTSLQKKVDEQEEELEKMKASQAARMDPDPRHMKQELVHLREEVKSLSDDKERLANENTDLHRKCSFLEEMQERSNSGKSLMEHRVRTSTTHSARSSEVFDIYSRSASKTEEVNVVEAVDVDDDFVEMPTMSSVADVPKIVVKDMSDGHKQKHHDDDDDDIETQKEAEEAASLLLEQRRPTPNRAPAVSGSGSRRGTMHALPDFGEMAPMPTADADAVDLVSVEMPQAPTAPALPAAADLSRGGAAAHWWEPSPTVLVTSSQDFRSEGNHDHERQRRVSSSQESTDRAKIAVEHLQELLYAHKSGQVVEVDLTSAEELDDILQ